MESSLLHLWSLEPTKELISVLEWMLKSTILPLRRNIKWLISQPARLLQPRPGQVISFSCCKQPVDSKAGCVSGCLKSHMLQWQWIRRLRIAENSSEVCPPENMHLRIALKVWKYCIYSGIFFLTRTNTIRLVLQANWRFLCFQISLEL